MALGLQLEQKKEDSLSEWTVRKLLIPEKAILSLRQSFLDETKPCVRVGDNVLVGQKIAEPVGDRSVALHASLSGTVSRIEEMPHPLFGKSEAIEIISDGKDRAVPELGQERKRWETLGPEELYILFREAGLLDMVPGGKALHSLAGRRENKVLILNACESEPYLTGNHFLILSRPEDLLKGAEILKKAMGCSYVVIATDSDKLQAAELLRSKIYLHKAWERFEVCVFPNRHPLEMPEVLEGKVKSFFRKTKSLSAGAEYEILDLSAALAVYEAVVFHKPLYERVITLAGECVVGPKNILVRIGATFENALQGGRKMLRLPGKVIMGGPMRGIAQSDWQSPVLKVTQAILALPKEMTAPQKVEPCIRCGDCSDVCPAEISPAMLTLMAEHDDVDGFKSAGLEECILCGNCAYVCPSKRPMVGLIRRALSLAGK